MIEHLTSRIDRLSMRSKVFLTAVAMMVAADLLIVVAYPLHSRRMELKSVGAAARSTAGMLAERLERGLFSQPGLDRFLEFHSDQIRFVIVTGPHGEERLAHGEEQARAARYTRATDAGFYDPDLDIILVRTAVTLTDGGPGALVLGFSTREMEEHVAEVRWMTTGVAVALLFLGILTAGFISRQMTRPLRRMALVVEHIAAGDLSKRLEVGSNDELGAIASAFNATVENLEFAYRELRTTIQDLERRANDLQREVVQRQRAVEAMRESEYRFRTLAGATFEGIGISEGSVVIDANEQLASMFGLERDDLLGKAMMDMVAPEFRDFVLALMREGATGPYEHRALRKDGTTFPVEVRARMLELNGRLLRVAAIRDITDRTLAEENLRRAHEGLERKVEERTAELQLAHQALQREFNEREAVARAMRESEERYRSLVNNMTEVVFQTDAGSLMTFVNPSWTGITGMPVAEALGRPLSEFVLEEDVTRLNEVMSVLTTGTESTARCEVRIPTRQRTLRWVEVSAHRLPSERNAFTGIAGTLRDVTDLRETERALRESKDFIDRIVNSVGDPLFVKDRQHRWVVMNDAMCSFMGRRREELLSKSDYDFFPKSEADVFWAKDEEVFATRQENLSEEQFTDAAGITHSIMTKKNLYVDDRGAVFIVGIIRDISLIKEAEREIRKLNEELERRVAVRTYELQTANKELLREIAERKRVESELRKITRAVEQSPSSVVITDTRGNIEYVNPRFVQVTGYDPEEVLGRNPRILKSGHNRPEEYKVMWDTILSGREWRGEMQNKKKNGEFIWEAMLISPLKDSKGVVTHFIAVNEDITARKSLELQFRRTQRLEIIGTLAGGIAHDLNNVLSPILMGIQILRLKVNDDKGRQILTRSRPVPTGARISSSRCSRSPGEPKVSAVRCNSSTCSGRWRRSSARPSRGASTSTHRSRRTSGWSAATRRSCTRCS